MKFPCPFYCSKSYSSERKLDRHLRRPLKAESMSLISLEMKCAASAICCNDHPMDRALVSWANSNPPDLDDIDECVAHMRREGVHENPISKFINHMKTMAWARHEMEGYAQQLPSK